MFGRALVSPARAQLLEERARSMRFNPTRSEEWLWRRLSGSKTGFAFRRQMPNDSRAAEINQGWSPSKPGEPVTDSLRTIGVPCLRHRQQRADLVTMAGRDQFARERVQVVGDDSLFRSNSEVADRPLVFGVSSRDEAGRDREEVPLRLAMGCLCGYVRLVSEI